MNNWTVSNGSVTGYNQNGDTAENQRSAAANPWGDTGIIWGTFPDGTSGADGGWNTPDFNIDNTKLYRFSVWVKRTSSTSGGTFYFGMYAGGDGSRRMDNSAVEGNAYWSCIGTSGLVQNVWHLYVGHVYPSSTSYTGRHPDTGYYFVNNPTKQGDVNGCNIGTGDLKWSSNSTTGIHRTYHYYCGDTTTRLQFYNPRVDLVDGKQPSITELVTRSPIQWKDLSGNRNNGTINGATFNSANGGSIVFNGSSQYVSVSSLITGNQSFSWGAWIYPTATGTPVFFGNVSTGLAMLSYWDSANNKVRVGTYGADRLTSGTTILPSNWGYTFWTWDGTTLTSYTNGIADGTATGFSFNISNLYTTIGNAVNAQYFAGRIAQTLVYNRVLSAAEIMQNFQATKTRFGL